METFSIVPAVAGILGVGVMTLFLRRARIFHLPETQMIRAVGSMITKKYETALLPGTIIHVVAGIIFAYFYWFFLQTAPASDGRIIMMVVICTMIGFVHGLLVTLFLVISVSQYHPLDRFRKLEPGDMISHVIAHIAFGATLGFCFSYLPQYLG